MADFYKGEERCERKQVIQLNFFVASSQKHAIIRYDKCVCLRAQDIFTRISVDPTSPSLEYTGRH